MEQRTKEYLSFAEFYNLEKEMDLFSLQYKGVNYWQLIRLVIYLRLSYSSFNVSGNAVSQNIWKELSGALMHGCKMKRMWRRLPKVDILRIRTAARFGENGTLADRQFDYIDLGDGASIADVYALGHYGSVPAIADITMASAEVKFILWKIKGKLFGKGKFDQEQEVTLNRFFEMLTQIYGVKFSTQEMISEIIYLAENYLCYRATYLKLFKKMSPRVIMLYPHYDQHMFSAITAAKELGIKTVEIQHGEVVDHGGYWYEDRSAVGKMLPDYFLAHGQWWVDNMQIPECMKAIAVGYPYLDEQVKLYPSKNNEKTITFFSNIISGIDLVRRIEACYGEITEMGYKVVFKLHTGEVSYWRKEYPFLVEHPEIEVVESGSIYKLISESTIVMGVRSTVFYEALVYGNVMIALDPKGNMRYLLDNHLAYAVSEKKDLLSVLETKLEVGENKGRDLSYMWRSYGNRNTAEFIQMLISQTEKVE